MRTSAGHQLCLGACDSVSPSMTPGEHGRRPLLQPSGQWCWDGEEGLHPGSGTSHCWPGAEWAFSGHRQLQCHQGRTCGGSAGEVAGVPPSRPAARAGQLWECTFYEGGSAGRGTAAMCAPAPRRPPKSASAAPRQGSQQASQTAAPPRLPEQQVCGALSPGMQQALDKGPLDAHPLLCARHPGEEGQSWGRRQQGLSWEHLWSWWCPPPLVAVCGSGWP